MLTHVRPLLEERVPVLDGIRGLAILMVVVGHSSEPGLQISGLFWGVYALCWIGVELFFVLSGFLITTLLIESLGTAGFFSKFYMRRALRIVPLFYVLLTLFTYILPLIMPSLGADPLAKQWQSHAPWYFAFLGNILVLPMGDFPLDPLAVSWSLSVEEQFYLAWPFVVMMIMKHRPLLCLGGIMFGSVLLRLILFSGGWSQHALYVFTPTRLEPLIWGSILAVVRSRGHLLPSWPFGRVALGCLAILAISEAANGLLWLYGGSTGVSELVESAIYYPAIGLLFATLLGHCLTRPTSRIGRSLSRPWIRQLGLWSYGIYLTHNLFNHGLQRLGLTYGLLGNHMSSQLLHYFLTFSLSLIAGAACYYGVERPFLAMRRRLVNKGGAVSLSH